MVYGWGIAALKLAFVICKMEKILVMQGWFYADLQNYEPGLKQHMKQLLYGGYGRFLIKGVE